MKNDRNEVVFAYLRLLLLYNRLERMSKTTAKSRNEYVPKEDNYGNKLCFLEETTNRIQRFKSIASFFFFNEKQCLREIFPFAST